jgi:hypothetical protein
LSINEGEAMKQIAVSPNVREVKRSLNETSATRVLKRNFELLQDSLVFDVAYKKVVKIPQMQ